MAKIKQAVCLVLAVGACSILIGCSSPPAEELKPMQAGDGTSKPVAGGASGGGGGAAAAPNASSASSTQAK